MHGINRPWIVSQAACASSLLLHILPPPLTTCIVTSLASSTAFLGCPAGHTTVPQPWHAAKLGALGDALCRQIPIPSYVGDPRCRPRPTAASTGTCPPPCQRMPQSAAQLMPASRHARLPGRENVAATMPLIHRPTHTGTPPTSSMAMRRHLCPSGTTARCVPGAPSSPEKNAQHFISTFQLFWCNFS